MESGNVSGTDIGSDEQTHQVATPSENSHVSPGKKLRSPSHSSSSTGEAVQLGSHGTSTSNAGVNSMLNSGQTSDGSATPISPTQATEQPAGGLPSGASDRIPAHIFSRTSTAGPTEWSVASNESLFSIHMGNTSFSADQLRCITKSGELGYTIDYTLSGPLADIPSNCQTPTKNSTEITNKSGNLNEGRYGVTEAAAAETMREVLMEKESQQKENIAKESPHYRSISQHSDASVKSFAFPILTGDADKSTKIKNQLSRPSTPKATSETLPETPKPQSPPGTPKPETAKSQTPKATQNAGKKRWFSCFSCCPFCF
ncbi:uncharacterized protein LOC111289572 [Durio zibethinus]|uniref:Uncharacterized protein LOC111289572 n=1 Tax=Durio zibethinus TaxID=66656 RepID=A0A6P5Y7T4_DURZI|nr:uncharacterized protein LOC111289572 [Durio zibethinus]